MEMGKRYEQSDFPKTNWNLKKYLWLPLLKLHGFFRMSLFKHAWVLSGVGVGGGSLVYANTLWEPPRKVWKDTHWAGLMDWEKVMPSFYSTAKKMLGATQNTYLGDCDKVLKETAEKQGFGDSFYTPEENITPFALYTLRFLQNPMDEMVWTS